MLQADEARTPPSEQGLLGELQRFIQSIRMQNPPSVAHQCTTVRIASELRMEVSTTGSDEDHAEHCADQDAHHADHVDGRLRRSNTLTYVTMLYYMLQLGAVGCPAAHILACRDDVDRVAVRGLHGRILVLVNLQLNRAHRQA